MSFSLSSRNIVLDGTILRAECGDARGGYPASEFHLDIVLGNDNGKFRWLWRDFQASALDVHLEGSILHAKLWPFEGEPCEASIDLDERICNYYGELTLILDDGTYSRLGQTKTSDGAFTTDNYFQTSFDFDEDERTTKDALYASEASVRRDQAAAHFHNAPLYNYTPLLSPRRIRLVKIIPQDVLPVFIFCSIQEFDLDTAPPFSALSYTWGNPFPSTTPELDQRFHESMTIGCDGKRMKVSQNLYEVLRRLRHTKIDEPREEMYDKTPLIEKAGEGLLLEVENLLREGADVNAVDKWGNTALHYAAEYGYVLIVKALVYAGSNVRAIDKQGRTPLDCARIKRFYSGPWIEIQQFLEQQLKQAEPRRRQASCLRDRISEYEYFWIDAICINQVDYHEKSSQVALMGEIYNKAANTIVWLGPTYDKWDDPALTLLQGIWTLEGARQNEKIEEGVLERMLSLFDKPNPYDVPADESNPASFAVRDWINTFDGNSLFDGWLLGPPFFHRTWFSRVWILQEVFMARDISMVCGQYVVPWDILIFMSSFIEGMRSSFRYKRSEQKRIIGARVVCGQSERVPALQLEYWKRQFRKSGKLPMINALQLTRNAHGTDPRDKVFSALSFSTMKRTTGNGVKEFEPDYTATVETLYTDVGIALMEAYGPCALSMAGRRKDEGDPNLPSWVPDLRIHLAAPPSGIDVEDIRDGTAARNNAVLDTATGIFQTSLLHITPDRKLELAGVILDSVNVTTIPGLNAVGNELENLSAWVELINSIDIGDIPGQKVLWHTLVEYQKDSTTKLTDVDFRNWLILLCCTSFFDLHEHLQTSLQQCFVPDVDEVALETLNENPEHVASLIEKAKSLFAALKIPVENDDTIPHSLHAWFNQQPSLAIAPAEYSPGGSGDLVYNLAEAWETVAPLAEPFGKAIQEKDPARRLMKLKERNAVGTVPEMAQVGDLLCLIHGARIPYVLRRRADGNFTYIGEAYVYGMRPQHDLLNAMMEGRIEKICIV